MIRVFFSADDWAAAAADEILCDAGKKIAFVLSGGSTPALVYRELAGRKFPWQKADVYLADERFVPAVHADSNARLIRENFLVPANFHFWETALKTPVAAATAYDALLRKQKQPFDVVILGIGEDGHFASLFPNSPALDEQAQLAMVSFAEGYPIRERLTMTLPVIMTAKKIVVLLQGEKKLPVLQELETGKKSFREFPANILREHQNFHVFYQK